MHIFEKQNERKTQRKMFYPLFYSPSGHNNPSKFHESKTPSGQSPIGVADAQILGEFPLLSQAHWQRARLKA